MPFRAVEDDHDADVRRSEYVRLSGVHPLLSRTPTASSWG